MNPLFEELNKIHLSQDGPKVEHEYQALCLKLEELLGKSKRIWSIPYQPWFTEAKGWRAIEIMEKRGIKNINYFIGIIKKL